MWRGGGGELEGVGEPGVLHHVAPLPPHGQHAASVTLGQVPPPVQVLHTNIFTYIKYFLLQIFGLILVMLTLTTVP